MRVRFASDRPGSGLQRVTEPGCNAPGPPAPGPHPNPSSSERFLGSVNYEHPYRLKVGDVVTLAAEVEAYRLLHNTIRPHEALDFERPLERYIREPRESHLFSAASVQDS